MVESAQHMGNSLQTGPYVLTTLSSLPQEQGPNGQNISHVLLVGGKLQVLTSSNRTVNIGLCQKWLHCESKK